MIGLRLLPTRMAPSKIIYSFNERWNGTCWYIYNHVKYEFDLQFEVYE